MIYLLKKISVSFGLLLIIFMSIFGMMFFQHGGMGQKAQASMCPFMPAGTVVCTMTPMEHIEKWQNSFAALPVTDFALILSIFLVSIFFVVAYNFSKLFSNLLPIKSNSWIRRSGIFVPTDPLQEAFSNGILNPKTF